MEPALHVSMLWLLFGGTHVGLATRRIRAGLVARFGELGFTLIFSAVAAATYTLLVRFYADHRFEGARGLGLGDVAALRWPLIATIVIGVTLAVAGVLVFPASPMALFSHRIRSPRGLERITRHPFFAGVALAAVAHALLATRAVGTAFFVGLAALAAAGAVHQDRKLTVLRGPAYAEYLRATSFLPFAAIMRDRGRIAWGDVPVAAILLGIGAAAGLRTVHGAIFSHHGLWVIGVSVGGAAILGVLSWRRAQRTAHVTAPATPRPAGAVHP